MAKEIIARFGVGSSSGQRGEVWRLWGKDGKPDVYVAPHHIGGQAKASFHADHHYFGLTQPERERFRAAGVVPPRNSMWEPAPLPQDDRIERLVLIVEPASETVIPPPWDGHNVIWVPTARPEHAVEFQVWRGPHGVQLDTSVIETLWRHDLDDERAVTVTWREVEVGDAFARFKDAMQQTALADAASRARLDAGHVLSSVIQGEKNGLAFLLHLAISPS